MSTGTDPMLEADHLEELLETPAPPVPVVVVQYRNRGVSSWVFFPLLFLVPLIAIFVYHRIVVENYRIEAARDRSALTHRLKLAQAAQPLVREEAVSTAVLPSPSAVTVVTNAQQTPAAPVSPAAASAVSPSTSVSVAASALTPPKPKQVSTDSPPASQPTKVESTPEKPVEIAGRKPRVTAPVPSSEPAAPSTNKPPIPLDRAGATAVVGRSEEPASIPPGALDARSVQKPKLGEPSGLASVRERESPFAADSGQPDPFAQKPTTNQRSGPQPLPPLPTKEEAQRQIEEEAAKRLAEMQSRNLEMLSKQREEQLEFRRALREALQTKRRAGADIEALRKRYETNVDQEKFDQALHVWKYVRKSQEEKVRYARSLELPESTILSFLCMSIDARIGTRGGPKDQNDVWVLAARALLLYPLPAAGGRPAAGAGPATSTPRRTVVSTPR